MIDLNVATAGELDSVPALKGHGFEIVRCRDERGRFNAFRELNEVPGLAGKLDDEGIEGTSIGGRHRFASIHVLPVPQILYAEKLMGKVDWIIASASRTPLDRHAA